MSWLLCSFGDVPLWDMEVSVMPTVQTVNGAKLDIFRARFPEIELRRIFLVFGEIRLDNLRCTGDLNGKYEYTFRITGKLRYVCAWSKVVSRFTGWKKDCDPFQELVRTVRQFTESAIANEQSLEKVETTKPLSQFNNVVGEKEPVQNLREEFIARRNRINSQIVVHKIVFPKCNEIPFSRYVEIVQRSDKKYIVFLCTAHVRDFVIKIVNNDNQWDVIVSSDKSHTINFNNWEKVIEFLHNRYPDVPIIIPFVASDNVIYDSNI
ncbi:MAG: hypothetical protein LBP59_10835 [Planctomycetaceae bacterium]|jgi:hypothetical protein|nr:hypothetical protein [Planctomycetaceae bacterium]